MTSPLTCFACDREPLHQCPRCGRPYCDEHGEELCDACLDPRTGVPSVTLYRGTLLALLVGAVVAVFLLVQPSDSRASDAAAVRPTVVATAPQQGSNQPAGGSATPATNQTPANATPQPTQTGATTTPSASSTVAATGTAQPRPAGSATAPAGATATATPAGGSGDYVVRSGDSLSSICAQVKPASMSTSDCIDRVVSLNGLSSADAISIGQSLKVPR